ncbi:MAG: HD domain-containing protein, partial [Deltaproteobacteria bacterium]|nr:HD domain-containing protein [Deltaproteobacteria bacterium]
MAPPIDNYREHVLFVDQSPEDLVAAMGALSPNYRIKGFPNTGRMLDWIERKGPPKLIFLDVKGTDPLLKETLRRLSEDPDSADTPVILLTKSSDDEAAAAGLAAGAVDYLPKPYLRPLMRRKVEFHLAMEEWRQKLREQIAILKSQHEDLAVRRQSLRQAVEERTNRTLGVQSAVLETVAQMAKRPDDILCRSGRHDLGVMLRAVAEQGLYPETGQWDKPLVVQSSRLHDVGKLAIEEAILKKPDKLTRQEFETVKLHTTLGVDMLSKMDSGPQMRDFLRFARIFAGTHHERWDGGGYPKGLSGEDIPLAGRLMAIADVYEGLTAD